MSCNRVNASETSVVITTLQLHGNVKSKWSFACLILTGNSRNDADAWQVDARSSREMRQKKKKRKNSVPMPVMIPSFPFARPKNQKRKQEENVGSAFPPGIIIECSRPACSMLHGLEGPLDAAIASQFVILGLFARAEDAVCEVLLFGWRRLQREVGDGGRLGGEGGADGLRVLDGAQALLEALDASNLVVGWLGTGANNAGGGCCGDERHVGFVVVEIGGVVETCAGECWRLRSRPENTTALYSHATPPSK